jgi:glycosyltransferase involved in cell wall biosynthesis
VAAVRKVISNSPNLKKRLKILGNLSNEAYLSELKRATGILHGALYDNGTFSIVEGAWYGIPSLSSEYPAIREICRNFNIQPALFNPYKPDSLFDALVDFEVNLSKFKTLLPSRESLEKFTFSALAPKYWNTFKQAFDSSTNSAS